MSSTVGINRASMVETARRCLNTPFRHQGRLPQIGIDCVGVLVHVARAHQMAHVDRRAYPRRPDKTTLLAMLREQPSLYELDSYTDAQEADVLVFEFIGKSRPQHVGMKTTIGLIHADGEAGFVTEHPLDADWLGHITHAFGWKVEVAG